MLYKTFYLKFMLYITQNSLKKMKNPKTSNFLNETLFNSL